MMAVHFGVILAAITLAWVLARKRPEHRPIAILLSFGLAFDVGVHVFDVAVLAPLREAVGVQVPWTGAARAAALVSSALVLAWPAALVAAVLHVFTRKPARLAALGWALAVLFFAIAHPVAGNGSQALAFLGAQVISAGVCAAVVIAWYRRASNRPQPEHLALALIVAAEVVSILGAWTHGPFEQWPVSQMLYLTLFGVLVLVQGRQAWTSAHASS